MICGGAIVSFGIVTISTPPSYLIHQAAHPTSPKILPKRARDLSCPSACSMRKPGTRIQLLSSSRQLKVLEVGNRRRRIVLGMELDILGTNFGCLMSSLLDAKIPTKDCLLSVMSKVLGYCIIGTSILVKLPQILKVLKHGSIRGLSVASFELEVIGYTIALAYCIHKGLPFSAYGELAFLLVQAIVLIAIIYYYSQPTGNKTWMKALLYCGLAPTVLAGKIDPALFEALYASQHAIFFCARVPQIWKNFTNKSTGELSFLTCFMNFVGSTVRVFTSIQEGTPLSVIMGSAIGIVMHGTILSQILIYQKPVPKKEKKVE